MKLLITYYLKIDNFHLNLLSYQLLRGVRIFTFWKINMILSLFLQFVIEYCWMLTGKMDLWLLYTWGVSCGFNPWVGKIPWRRAWQPTPVFLHGESYGQRSLAGYSPWGHKGSDTTERLNSNKGIVVPRLHSSWITRNIYWLKLMEIIW